MPDCRKQRSFFDIAALLYDRLGITPLLYGSVGLEYLTGEALSADDIDILIPEIYLHQKWPSLLALMEENGYSLIDAHEHTFEKNSLQLSYASLEDLLPFAGIAPSDIAIHEKEGRPFRLLNLAQYRRVYEASSQDGYRIHTRGKKDGEKLAFIARAAAQKQAPH